MHKEANILSPHRFLIRIDSGEVRYGEIFGYQEVIDSLFQQASKLKFRTSCCQRMLQYETDR